MGHTNHNLEMRLKKHQGYILPALKQNFKPEDFPDHFILYYDVSFISRGWGLERNLWETIEIKKIIFKNTALIRDKGELGVNSIYDNLLNSDRVRFIQLIAFDLFLIVSPNNANNL